MYEFYEATCEVAVRTADPRIRGDISRPMRYVAANNIHPALRDAPDDRHISFDAIRLEGCQRQVLQCGKPPALKAESSLHQIGFHSHDRD